MPFVFCRSDFASMIFFASLDNKFVNSTHGEILVMLGVSFCVVWGVCGCRVLGPGSLEKHEENSGRRLEKAAES